MDDAASVAPLDWTEVRLARLDARKPIRKLPGLVRDAARLLWRVSPWRFAVTAALQVLIATGAATQLVAGRNALAEVLAVPPSSGQADATGATGALEQLHDLVPSLVTLAVLTAGLQILRSIEGLSQERLKTEVAHTALGEVLDVSAGVDLEAFESATFFDRLQRAAAAARDRPWATVRALIGLVADVLGFVALASVLATLEPVLVPFVVIATLPGLAVTTRLTRARHRLHLRLAQDARREDYLVSVLTGRDEAKEVRSFNLAPGLRRLHDALAQTRMTAQHALARKSARERLVATALSSLTTGAGVAVLAWFVIDGRMGPADAAAAGYAMQRIQRWLASAVRNATSLYDGTFFLDDYAAFVTLGKEVAANRPTTRVTRPFDELRATGLGFTYPGSDRPALTDVDLTIRRGEVVAVVGENGSGKTTLAKVLAGLYAPTTGRLTWDGVDVQQVDPASLREHVAVIFQDFARYRLTARENIGFGRDERVHDADAVRAAAEAAGASEFLEGLPAGYETLLSKDLAGGRDLSIGQWQRVATARAFFRDADFLVLDEPTSALDPKSEHALFQQLRRLAIGRTALLISHRFSSVREADRILVLDGGRLVEQGTHDELVADGGLYAHLFRLQAAAYTG